MNKRKTWILFMVGIVIIRIWIGEVIGIWFPSDQYYDDALMINYANFSTHFSMGGVPEYLLMVKEMAFPLFLNIVHLSGMSYSMCLSVCWIIAAACVYIMLSNYTSNKKFLSLSFLLVLFNPAAFDSWLGTRLYRNAIIIPFTLIVFSLMFILDYQLISGKSSVKKNIVMIIIFGVIFSFTYYIKEDGIWLLACLIFNMLICTFICIGKYIKEKKKILTSLLMIFMPFAIFVIAINIYKGINYHYFGIYETNTRTNGELGEFVEKIYKIESTERTTDVWAPEDAIKKAFNASPTLKKNKKIFRKIEKSYWGKGNLKKNPIKGDYLTWALRYALDNAGLWESEKQVSELFHQINEELDEAFQKGTLKKDKKIQLVSSMGGRSLQEIISMKDMIIKTYKITILLEEYSPGGILPMPGEEEVIDSASMLCNMNLRLLSESAIKEREQELEKINSIVLGLFKIYKVINVILLFGAIVGICINVLMELKEIIQKRKWNWYSIAPISIALCMFGIALAYAVSISWFCSFLDDSILYIALKFYSCAMVSFFNISVLFGCLLLVNRCGNIREKH